MATFWEIAAHSVGHLYSFFCLYIFPISVLRAGFWLLIAPVPVHCFAITLTKENGKARIEIQRRRYDELSLEMCKKSMWREKRPE